MASYSATIEVGTKGTAALEKLLARVNTLSGSIDKVNRSTVFGSKQVASLNEYNRTLKEATANLAKTRVVLDKSGQAAGNYAKAIRDYVDALGSANGAQDLTNKLVQQEIQGREKATAALKEYNAAAASARQAGGSMAGRYMRPGAGVSTAQAYSSPIGPEPSFVFSGQSTAVGGRIKAIKAAQAAMVAAETEVNRVTRTFEQQETVREKANDKLVFDKKMALLDAEHQKTLKLNKEENDVALKDFDRRLNAQTRKKADQAKAQAGRSRKFTDIATGAGFPLLFGGGPIQALAGGLGGAAGGLGGAIAASAIAAQVEAFAKDTAAVGQALNSTSGALELMREKSLFSKDAIKKRAAELENLGEIEKLSALLTTELVQKIGNEGVTALQDLGTESDKTTRLWSALTLQLQALIAGPLKDFFALINSVLGAVTTSGQFKVLESELTGQARTDFDADVASRRAANLAATASGATGASGMMSSMGTAGGVGVLSPADQRELVEKYLPKLQVTADIPDLGGVKPPKTKVEKDRLPSLNIELGLKQKLLVLNKQIAQAALNEDKVTQTLLEKDKVREISAAKIDKIKAKGLASEVEAKEIAIERVNQSQQIQDIDSKAAQVKAQEAKKVEELVGNLENEGALIKAKLNGREDEVRLTQEIAEKTEGLEKADATRVENLIRGNAELEKQAAIADRMQQIYDQIGQSIASGVVDTLSAAVDQTKSLADTAADALRNVASILLQLGVNTALKSTGAGLFSGLSGFANGGRPPVGKPSIVGERGPELFVPNTSGTIVPNNKLGGGGATNVVVNVDAKGSSASGDSGAGKQLGGLIGAAVQAELIKQQRPGGLLSR